MKTWSVILLVFAGVACTSDNRGSPKTDSLKPRELIAEQAFGGASASEPITTPDGVVIGAEDTTFISDARAHKFFVFDKNGKFVRTIGRDGKGPGEFSSISVAGVSGDTLWAFDLYNGRTTFFAGNKIHTQDLPKDSSGNTIRPNARLANGTWIVVTQPRFGTPAQMAANPDAPDQHAVIHLDSSGKVLSTIHQYTCKSGIIFPRMSNGTLRGVSMRGSPIRDCDFVATNQDGSVTYVIEGNSPRSTDPAIIVITQLDAGGQQRWKTSLPYTPRAIPEAVIESLSVFSATNSSTGKINAEHAARYRKALAYYTHFPPVTQAVAGIDGTLFLRREIGDSIFTYTMLDSKGVPTGTFKLPAKSYLLAGRASHIWVSELDAQEETRVVRYQIK
jgi:hypothetical protein